MSHVNCRHFSGHGLVCTHESAPHGIFFYAKCIVLEPSKDIRAVPGCRLQLPNAGINGKPTPPPNRVQRMGDSREYTAGPVRDVQNPDEPWLRLVTQPPKE